MAEEDVIYGKNRHFYGGIEPSNMKAFAVVYTRHNDKNVAKITATLPDNTVVGSQTLCTVAGAVIRRKTGGVPVNEFDGELFADIKASGVFYDENVITDTTYSYAAFPYTTQGVYRRDSSNAATVTILSGWIPEPLTKFTAVTNFVSDAPKVTLRFEGPRVIETDVENVKQYVSGVMIRRSKDSYPVDETQGVLVADVKISGENDTYSETCVDESVEINATYYYAAFPYSESDVYNRDPINRVLVTIDVGAAPFDMPYFVVYNARGGKTFTGIIDIDMPGLPEGVGEGVTVKVMIRRSSDHMPMSIDDGELVVTFTEDSHKNYSGHKRFWDYTTETGTVTLYYRAFPISSRGAVNTNDVSANKQELINVSNSWRFGCRIQDRNNVNANSNPASMVDYGLDDTGFDTFGWMNKRYSPVTSNHDGTKDLHEWGNIIPGTCFMPRPCVLNVDGTVAFYLNPNNYDEKEDTTPSDYITYCDTYGANVMLEWSGPIFVKSMLKNDIWYWEITNVNYTSDVNYSVCYNFLNYDENDLKKTKIMKKYYSAAFPSVQKNGVFKSNPNPNNDVFVGTTSTTPASVKSIAEKNNTDLNKPYWSLEPFYENNLYAIILVMMGKTTDIQSVFGLGRTTTTSKQDTLADKGMFFGSTTTNGPVKALGMVDLWGRGGRYVLGATLTSYLDDNAKGTYINIYAFIVNSAPNKPKRIWANDLASSDTKPGFFATSPMYGESDIVGLWWVYNSGTVAYKISLTQEELGNGYISTLHSAGFMSLYGYAFYPTKFSNPITNVNKTDEYNCLNGSATTWYCDYFGIKNYPSTGVLGKHDEGYPNLKTALYIPCHICGDKDNMTAANNKKDGIFSTYFANSLEGCTFRIRYIPYQDELKYS